MKNILIIRFSALGDLVTFEPIFRLLRKYHKDANIIFLTSQIGKELYQDSGYFNQIVVFKSIFDSKNIFKNIYFDLVVNLQCTKKSHFITSLLRKKRLINRNSNFWQKLFGIKKEAKTFEQILLKCCIPKEIVEDYKKNKLFFINLPAQKNSFDIDKKTVAISTGSSQKWISKRWGIENFNNLIKKLIENDFEIILVGSKLEAIDGEKILKDNPLHVRNFINKTSLNELKSILKGADLYIGNDSGPTHIAAAVGTNTITIFTSTSTKHCVKNWNYFGQHECFAPREFVKCSPCYKSHCLKNNDEYMQCAKSIQVEDIYKMALKMLKEKK